MEPIYAMTINLFSEIDKALSLALFYTTKKRSVRITMPRKLYWSLKNINSIDFCETNGEVWYRGYPIEFDEYLADDGIAILYEKEEYNEG